MDAGIGAILSLVSERSFQKAVRTLAGKTILLYGAGGFGLEMLHYLCRENISVSAVLDRRAGELKELDGVPIFTAERAPFDKQNCIVLLCIVMDKDERGALLNHLQELGYAQVIEAQSLRCLMVQPDDHAGETVSEYYQRRADKICRAGNLFSDKWSVGVYDSVVRAHATGDYSSCIRWESPMKQQYFPADVPLAKGYRRFLDCGGYTGDTIAQILNHEGTIEACAVFEPDSGNYAHMTRRLHSLRDKIGQRWLFPCAVSSDTGLHAFAGGTGSGALSDQGSGVVQTVSLDQAVADFHPTCIKMDIEGAEPAAILGAKQIITQDRPDLAVCVYHAVNHIWDIPLLLDSWNLNYRFFLRSYNAYTMETVLYATVGQN